MKRLAILLLASTLLTGHAFARATNEETTIAAVAAATIGMADKCGAKVTDGGLGRIVDGKGLDGDKVMRAITAAIAAQSGLSYDREDIVPEITRAFNMTLNEIYQDVQTDRIGTCSKWLKMLRTLGTSER
jgi:hypothetical protein